MSELSYRQEIELLENLDDALITEGDWELIVNESIDSTLPVYYTDLIREWTEAGAPQPDDNQGDIFNQMAHGLWELMNSFAYNLLSEATDCPTARELVQTELGVRKGYANLAEAIIR